MDVEYAKTLLRGCVRSELQDHAFGDAEVFWTEGETEVATGYFSRGIESVSITVPDGQAIFTGETARELRTCGVEGTIGRNDETGPDEFVEGRIMPGLTPELVYKELTGEDM